MKFFSTLFSLFSSLLNKGERGIKKQFGIDLYKASFEDMKLKHRELNEDLLDMQTEFDFNTNQKKELQDSLLKLEKELKAAKKEKNSILFSKLAIEYQSYKKKIESLESLLSTIAQSKNKIENYLKNLEIAIKEREVKLNELEFKNKATKSMESIQDIVGSIGEKINFSEFKEIEDNINKGFIKENIRSDLMSSGEFDKPQSYIEIEDMDKFFKENGIKEEKNSK